MKSLVLQDLSFNRVSQAQYFESVSCPSKKQDCFGYLVSKFDFLIRFELFVQILSVDSLKTT
jgi:hypothetical protein